MNERICDQANFFGWDTTTGKQSTYRDPVGFYRLWAGLATPDQAAAVERHLGDFDRPGGMAMSTSVVSASANIAVAAGYKPNVIGFGWSNGVFLRFRDLLQHGGSTATSAAGR